MAVTKGKHNQAKLLVHGLVDGLLENGPQTVICGVALSLGARARTDLQALVLLCMAWREVHGRALTDGPVQQGLHAASLLCSISRVRLCQVHRLIHDRLYGGASTSLQRVSAMLGMWALLDVPYN